MTEQLQLRRGTASQVVGFTGAQGEVVIDTTNNRAVVNDGSTAGGWPAAKLAEVITNTRTAVSDAPYTALASDRSVAYIALTAARVVTLPASSAYPAGTTLTVFDETGACSASNAITLQRAGSDTIDGATSAAISAAYGYLALQSNGAGKWTVLAQPAVAAAPSRTAVADAAYTALSSDRLIAYTALTAARIVTLCAAATYPAGTRLTIIDESGACSATLTITIQRAGSDTIDGATSFAINAAYGGLEIASNGAGAWTILSPRPNLQASLIGLGTAPDPSNVLSAYGASALLSGGANFNLTINKGGAIGASADTASLIFEDGFSGRAQMGLNGSDNFSFKVSPNGSSWTTAIAIDAATGAPTFANQRTGVSDAPYTALATDRNIAYTALTASRVVTLPAASAFPTGAPLTVFDESGACSATKTITLSRAGSDTIDGATSAVVAAAYGYLALQSNGAGKWTIVDASAAMTGDTGSGGAAGLVPAPPAASAAYNAVLGAGGGWVGQMAGFRNRIINGAMAIDQRNAGASRTIVAAAALAYTVDRFYAYCTGANVAGQRVAGSAPDQSLYQFTGAASVTAIGFGQRIETANSFDLAGQSATLSVKLANSLLTTVTWAAYYATTAHTFGTLASPSKTLMATGAFTVNSTLATYSAQIAIPGAATTGIEIVLSVAAQTSGTWKIGEVQLEPGQVATPFERRPIGVELALAQRYCLQHNAVLSDGGDYGFGIQSAYTTTNGWGKALDINTMRSAPTVALSSVSHLSVYEATLTTPYALTFAAFDTTPDNITFDTWTIGTAALVAGQAVFVYFNTASGWINLSAEL